MKRRTIIILAIVGVVALALGAVAFLSRNTQRSLQLERPVEGVVAVMPFSGVPYLIEIAPGLKLKFDTGADISSLSNEDVKRLRDMGVEVSEYYIPIIGRDGYGDYGVSWRRYRVDLPIGGYEEQIDSAGNKTLVYTGKNKNIVKSVDFAATDKPISSIGLDLLKVFKYDWDPIGHTMTLRTDVPENYHRIADITKNIHLTDYLWSDNRCYVIMSVNRHPHLFLVDTGLQGTSLKMPLHDTVHTRSDLYIDTVRTMNHSFAAYVDNQGWLDIGTRSGSRRIYYYNNSEDDYQFNPMNAFAQGMLIDIEGNALYFAPVKKTETAEIPADSIEVVESI